MFDLHQISQYRQQLMGFSIIVIVLFHSPVLFNNDIGWFIHNIGNIGVELFFLLSGMGLFYSLHKSADIKQFYRKRIIRIIPSYLLVAIPWLVIEYFFSDNLPSPNFCVDLFYRITTLDFWLCKYNEFWFIPAIVFYYFLSPLLYKVISRSLKLFIGLSAGILIFTLFLPQIKVDNTLLQQILFCVFRSPCFLLGWIIAKMQFSDKEYRLRIKNEYLVGTILVCLVLCYFILHPYSDIHFSSEYKYTVYVPLSFLLIILFTKVVSSYLYKNLFSMYILSFGGTYSLELYLIHERIVKIMYRMHISDSLNFIISIIIACVLAYILHKIIQFMIKVYGKL